MFTRILLPALALACAAPAFAEPVRVAVPYGDLDLTKEAGRQALGQRLDRATRKVCGTTPARNLTLLAAHRTCIAEARASYQPQVELALNAANARRVAVLADKLVLLASF